MASGPSAAIPGGSSNAARTDYSAVGGGLNNNASGYASVVAGGNGFLVDGNTVWTEGNDGHGSGLDADLLGGDDVACVRLP